MLIFSCNFLWKKCGFYSARLSLRPSLRTRAGGCPLRSWTISRDAGHTGDVCWSFLVLKSCCQSLSLQPMAPEPSAVSVAPLSPSAVCPGRAGDFHSPGTKSPSRVCGDQPNLVAVLLLSHGIPPPWGCREGTLIWRLQAGAQRRRRKELGRSWGASPAVGPFHPLGAARAEGLCAKANFSPDNCHSYY